MANNDVLTGNRIEDEVRVSYLAQHLAEVRAAIAQGVPVQGYFIWSLMDNYEWTHGYEKRFGIVQVDFETLRRTPKASYHALAAALAR
jgi:beta-glucosidase